MAIMDKSELNGCPRMCWKKEGPTINAYTMVVVVISFIAAGYYHLGHHSKVK